MLFGVRRGHGGGARRRPDRRRPRDCWSRAWSARTPSCRCSASAAGAGATSCRRTASAPCSPAGSLPACRRDRRTTSPGWPASGCAPSPRRSRLGALPKTIAYVALGGALADPLSTRGGIAARALRRDGRRRGDRRPPADPLAPADRQRQVDRAFRTGRTGSVSAFRRLSSEGSLVPAWGASD